MVSNKMNSKHRKTLKALFENPVRSNIVWGDIEKLFVGLETTILEGTPGSRVCVLLNDAGSVSSPASSKKGQQKHGPVSSSVLTSAEIQQ